MGMLTYCNCLSDDEISFLTENKAVADFFVLNTGRITGNENAVLVTEQKKRNGVVLYALDIPEREDRLTLLDYFRMDKSRRLEEADLPKEKKFYPQLVAGIFLACGSVNNPEKKYHMEFVMPTLELCNDFGMLLIDNYDSFTWNLYQYFCELGADVLVKRNDALTLADIDALKPQKIVISPGPCTPDEAGISLDVIRHYAGRLPILGVCLGHQAMAQAFGGKVVRAAKVMHGKTSPITHNGEGVFRGLANPLTVTRYHSLVVEPDSLPACFDVTAWSETREIMGIRHRQWDLEGVQFHPESILSEQGHQLLANFLHR